ncbi:MAG: sigma-70 family RNA polymerase sigma factor [Clostridia bacterium]|nr:sigma-70 family RNA polymerase sigma factor [Clostridia bacterium]
MDIDLDKKLYNDYLNGKVEGFETLYFKYKDKIRYFVFNIVKDYEKAEDITQEVFVDVLKNKFREDGSFKYYIYLAAKSKALNYLGTEKRRKDISEKYLENAESDNEKDALEIIVKHEEKKELLEAITLLDEKYKNAIYLVNIEGLSYEETANILEETLPNIKNLVHRGKGQLRKIMIKNNFKEMNKYTKILIIILCTSVLLSGVVYAGTKIYEMIKGVTEMTPTFTSKISTIDSNKVWVGTFNLVWNDFMDDIIGGTVEFENYYSELVNELNKQTFKSNQLNEDSYYKIHGMADYEMKNTIQNSIMEKFNENSTLLDNIEWGNPKSYILYAMLKKEFNYIEKFSTLESDSFGDSEEKVKYFGIDATTGTNASENIIILFYNSNDDFAVKLKTKEGEEIILYKTTGENKSFEENYKDILWKESNYNGSKNWLNADSIKIPFIKVNEVINYDELCGKKIKGCNFFIRQAIQNVEFELNNCGGSVKSEAIIDVLKGIAAERGREFIYDNDFIVYLKEADKEKPYFALKVDNTNVLKKEE